MKDGCTDAVPEYHAFNTGGSDGRAVGGVPAREHGADHI